MNKGKSDLDDNGRWLNSEMKALQSGQEVYVWKSVRVEEIRAEIKLRGLKGISEIKAHTMVCGKKEHYTLFKRRKQ